MGAGENATRLLKLPNFNQSLAIGGENLEIIRVARCRLLQNGSRLDLFINPAQSARIMKRCGFIPGIGLVALAPCFGELAVCLL